MNSIIRMIVGAVLFAVALLASSWFLKGNPAGNWVDVALYIGFAAFMLSYIVFSIQQSKHISQSTH